MYIYNNYFSRIYIAIFAPILCIRFAPHICCFLFSKKKDVIMEDLRNVTKIYDINILPFLWALRFNPYFVSLFYYRIGVSRSFICSFTLRDRSTLEITCGQIGKNVMMYHPFSTIINARSIGDNFTFRNNTTVGNKNDDQCQRPVIGNNVTLGANVVIFGGIVIGDNVIIGAGSVVNKDIPSNSVVVGNPCRIIRKL